MSKPRLVKRAEIIERKQNKQKQEPRPAAMSVTVRAVREMMVKEARKATGKLDPRAAFAALFSQPQTN